MSCMEPRLEVYGCTVTLWSVIPIINAPSPNADVSAWLSMSAREYVCESWVLFTDEMVVLLTVRNGHRFAVQLQVTVHPEQAGCVIVAARAGAGASAWGSPWVVDARVMNSLILVSKALSFLLTLWGLPFASS